MVTRCLSAPVRDPKPAVGGSWAFVALTSVLASLTLPSLGCEKVPLTAPTGTVITLVASANVLPLNGSTDIIAVLIENGAVGGTGMDGEATVGGSAGTPVHNGTLVSFTTSLGRIEPAEARTVNGRVTVKLISDGRSGTAVVTAFSGSATKGLEVAVGAAAAASVSVSASPGNLPSSGGNTTITARVEDATGNSLVGIPVNFTTSSGTLGSATVVTGQNGFATTSLVTTKEASVVASAGGMSGSTTVTIRSRSFITLSVTTPTIFTGASASFSVVPGSAVAFSGATLDFGDGRSKDLGAISSSTTVSHSYERSGEFDIVVHATDVDGGSADAVGSISVVPWQYFATGSPSSGTVNTVFSFSITGISSTVPIDHYIWNFGDGTPVRQTTSGSITHGFSSTGLQEVTVTIQPLYGDARTAQIEVRVIVS